MDMKEVRLKNSLAFLIWFFCPKKLKPEEIRAKVCVLGEGATPCTGTTEDGWYYV